MAVSADDIRHVAALARLEITEDEVQAMRQHFEEIMTYFNRLNELDLEGIDAFALKVEENIPWREDRAIDSSVREDVLAEAPHRYEDFFRVPRIVEEE
ncbi:MULTISPECIES: Asp-tRNA(Asn)/Glu-tRNA(Gln) amidotransferase subunit GatC [Aminobacterium]|jgi:aspartyl-tRNA(Asn)/glutamyl-tRNA(Gln) amidotransferase subunit C|uniref:Asp-tRNA(Asn)/Glu-tRNA(Gln) amidotransferase subunit GatC n=1 Tax=Aminobacterium TaxID=81466 RepID=UPI000A71F7E3|nr:Asp-tRNA(Asn)/Glu-tRNA(Gln) amidotransferase subunit GatC [Aminobacterium sp. EBM-42]MDD2378897.1 Asp-tRNA(Asn)/Glu-tRNA(Gln) amidotransferase subunit GatC [Aminobacterium colombiense]MDD4265096.1 Asp-tRNA(Asn)/Glu-tRNA(Gln) amidotransferase subunit GatC [Aminobacterium colombiense]MDD4585723.1 Asp-tRNA(Asn)/Glu-tRNA(Gln) amidotransferase subunit GatC [Aminobacterium colombiense]NLK31029.1 Asp-tRNA(Asn)/Glu-tRNA(Gln) amidotransferase subunit GatC [Aminobacterium colombiense]